MNQKITELIIKKNQLNFIYIFCLIYAIISTALCVFRLPSYYGFDEAEFLHVIYSFSRGEIPYLSYIENHPTILHAVIYYTIQKPFTLPPGKLYIALKIVILVLCIISAHLTQEIFTKNFKNEFDKKLFRAIFWVVFSSFSIWSWSDIYSVSNDLLWQLRPDWFCYTIAILGVYALTSNNKNYLGGSLIGTALAILPKAILIILPLALIYYSNIAATLHREHFREFLRYLAIKSLKIAFAITLTYTTITLIEIKLTNESPLSFYLSNFKINSIKHLHLTQEDGNPLNTLRNMTGFTLPQTIILGFCILFLIQSPLLEQKKQVLGAIAVIAINCTIPAYSNGLNYSHYMIPGLMATAGLASIAIYEISKIPDKLKIIHIEKINNIKKTAPFAILMVFSIFQIPKIQQIEDNLSLTQFFFNKLKITSPENLDRLPDTIFPKGLNYLTFSPESKPVTEAAWGYYFMLSRDHHHWVDNFRLGIGPNIESYWQDLIKTNPPDIVLASSSSDLESKLRIIEKEQDSKMDALRDYIEKNFECKKKYNQKALFRKDLVSNDISNDWKKCEK